MLLTSSLASTSRVSPRASFYEIISFFSDDVYTMVVDWQRDRDIGLKEEAESTISEQIMDRGSIEDEVEIKLTVYLELETILYEEYRYIYFYSKLFCVM